MTRIRIPEIDPARAPVAIREALATAPDLSVFRVAAHAESVLQPWLETGRALLESSAIPDALRELIIVQIAVSTRCTYVRTRHEQAAEELGVTREQLVSVLGGTLDDETLGDAGPVLRSVEEITRTHTIGAEGLDHLRTRLGERGAVEVLMLVGHYVGLSILASSADLPLPGCR